MNGSQEIKSMLDQMKWETELNILFLIFGFCAGIFVGYYIM